MTKKNIMNGCIRCGGKVPEELKIDFTQCPHHIHSDCHLSDPNRSYKKCGACLGSYEAAKQQQQQQQQVSKGKPRLMDNVDWCISPGSRNTGSKLVAVASYIPKYGKQFEETSENSTNPFFLINLGKQIPDIINENQLDLPHFCKVGVTMRDFLKNGYDWSDLQHFNDISGKGSKRMLQVIVRGLQTNANDFRDYPEELPFQEIKAKTKFNNGDVCRLFGLSCPMRGTRPGDPIEGGFLQCQGDYNWRAQDCVDLGLTFSDLQDFGLNYVHQYLQLMEGLSQREADFLDKALETTDKQIENLIDLEAEAEEMERMEEEKRKAAARARMEAEMAEREVEEIEEKIIQPIRSPTLISKPLYEKRSKQRDRFHGLKKK